jgi:hypothetical protein
MYRRTVRIALLLWIWIAGGLVVVSAAAAVELPPTVDQYLEALNSIETSRGRQSLQIVFELASESSPGIQAVLPSLSESEYGELHRRLKGFILTRGSIVYARPSATFFKTLARRKGLKADVAFFAAYAETEPDQNAIFPAYVRQQDGIAGCTIFSGPLMTGLYRKWLTFRTGYPDAYATEAQGELDSLDAELLSGICACEGREQVAAGLDGFVKALPDVPIAPKVRKRVEEIRAGTSHIRFECRS